MPNDKIQPFLRWAGGKNWFVKHINSFIPENGFNNYHEPFLGGGAVFFSVSQKNESFLSDLNTELIETFITVRDHVNDIINELKTYKNTAEFYYEIRENNFQDKIKKSARFIYLNQTSFNGIYRVNLEGKYNVPFGYRKKDFLDEKKLKDVSFALSNSTLFSDDFDCIRNNLKTNDLVFLDPPYTVSHNNNSFIKYNQKLFSLDDQYRLSSLIDFIKSKNAYYILTNAAHHKIRDIFNKKDKIVELNRASLIGGTKAKRGAVSEYIFTNINS